MLTTENHVVKNEVHNGWSVRKWLILFENNTWIYLQAEMKYIPGDFFFFLCLCSYWSTSYPLKVDDVIFPEPHHKFISNRWMHLQ